MSSSLMSDLATELRDPKLVSKLSLMHDDERQMQRLRVQAVNELIASEERYLEQLQVLKDAFVVPMEEKLLMTRMELKASFGHLETVLQVNRELLQCLKNARSDDELGSVFLRLSPFLRFYSTYAQDLQTSLHSLQSLQSQRPQLASFIAQQERTTNHAFNALLITPVQRIPRYRMLLQDIIDNSCSNELSEDSKLKLALKNIEDVAWHMNEHLGDQEQALRLLDIQNSLQGNQAESIIRPGRRLIRDGVLMKVSRITSDKGQERFFMLCNDCIIYCKIKADISKLPKANALEWCCSLPLKRCKVEPLVGKGVFKLTCVNEELILFPSNKSEPNDYYEKDDNSEENKEITRSWLDTIALAIDQHKKDAATLRKESSKKCPMRRPELLKMRKESLRLIMLNHKTSLSPAKTALSPSRSPLKQLVGLKRKISSNENNSDDKDGGKKRNLDIKGDVSLNLSAANLQPRVILTPISKTRPKEASLLRSLQTRKIGKMSNIKKIRSSMKSSSKISAKSVASAAFRSPSVYVEPREVLMDTYFSDDFGPLASPSQQRTDIKHLALQKELKEKIGAKATTDDKENETKNNESNDASLFSSCSIM